MDNILQVIFSVIGLVVYFWLQSRKAAQNKKPATPAPAKKKVQKTTAKQTVKQDTNTNSPQRRTTANQSLEDLLKQFTEVKKYEKEPEPETLSYERIMDIDTTYPSLLEESDKFVRRLPDVPVPNKLGKLLKNPQSVCDAIVLKEILDRKHFDV
jgi:hypothetical protein